MTGKWANKIDPKIEGFSDQKLKEMIVPLFFEQLLVMLVPP